MNEEQESRGCPNCGADEGGTRAIIGGSVGVTGKWRGDKFYEIDERDMYPELADEVTCVVCGEKFEHGGYA